MANVHSYILRLIKGSTWHWQHVKTKFNFLWSILQKEIMTLNSWKSSVKKEVDLTYMQYSKALGESTLESNFLNV